MSTVEEQISDLWENASGSTSQLRNSQLLMQQQNSYNVAQWHRENDYNSPVNQMDRLRAAGLNPNLAMSGGAANTASPMTPLSGSPSASNSMGALSASALNVPASIINSTSQAKLVDAQSRLLNAEAADKEADFASKSQSFGVNSFNPDESSWTMEVYPNFYSALNHFTLNLLSGSMTAQDINNDVEHLNWRYLTETFQDRLNMSHDSASELSDKIKLLTDSYMYRLMSIKNQGLQSAEALTQARLLNQTFGDEIFNSLVAADEMNVDSNGNYSLKPGSRNYWVNQKRVEAGTRAIGNVFSVGLGFGKYGRFGSDIPRPATPDFPSFSPSSPSPTPSSMPPSPSSPTPAPMSVFPGTTKTPTPEQAKTLTQLWRTVESLKGKDSKAYNSAYWKYLNALDKFGL